MIRKSLLLILVLALLSVPVFLMAHAFTHFVEADAISNTGSAHIEDDHDIDIDDICLDCLALTGLSTMLVMLGLLLVDQTTRQLLISQKTRHHFHKKSSPYCPRGPPPTSFAIF